MRSSVRAAGTGARGAARLRRLAARARRDRRAWVVDSLVFAVAGLASLVTLVLSATPVEGSGFRRPAEAELWLDLDGGPAVAWVALWWRRRFPVCSGCSPRFAAVVSAFAGGAATVMLLTVAVHRRWPWAVLAGGGQRARLGAVHRCGGPTAPAAWAGR